MRDELRHSNNLINKLASGRMVLRSGDQKHFKPVCSCVLASPYEAIPLVLRIRRVLSTTRLEFTFDKCICQIIICQYEGKATSFKKDRNNLRIINRVHI